MNILIFGATGFIGKNLVTFFSNDNYVDIAKIDEDDSLIIEKVGKADIIINASGVSRSESESDFFLYNVYHSQRLFSVITEMKNKMYIYFSSIHYGSDTVYGFSKRYNEFLLCKLDGKERNYFLCLRIPSVFGPGIKPNYVSVVATFCNNIANQMESSIIDGNKLLKLLYINDLLSFIDGKMINRNGSGFELVEFFEDSVEITVSELFETIRQIGIGKVKFNKKSKFFNNLSDTYNFYLNKL